MKSYNKKFFDGRAKIIESSWEKIYDIIIKNKPKEPKNIGDYILKNFCEYTEVIKLSGFSGIPFFKKDEEFDKRIALESIKKLGKDLKELSWFKKGNFELRERDQAGKKWDYFFDSNIQEKNPRRFPHYSIYIFPQYFAVDFVFHRDILKKIKKNSKLNERFLMILKSLGEKSTDYCFRAVNYMKIGNKEKARGVRKGEDYEIFNFSLQLNRFIKQNSKHDYGSKFNKYLEILCDAELKQLGLQKTALYADYKKYQKLANDGKKCLEFIKNVIDETEDFYNLIMDAYRKT